MQNTKRSIPSFPTSTIDLLHQVILSSYELLLEEYNNVQQDHCNCHRLDCHSMKYLSNNLTILFYSFTSSRNCHNSHHSSGHDDHHGHHAQQRKQLQISEDAKDYHHHNTQVHLHVDGTTPFKMSKLINGLQ